MSIRPLLSAVGASIALLVGACVAPAQAAAPGDSRITAHASDYTPTAGQVFIVRGRYLHDGSVAAGHTVRLQTYAGGGWISIAGARVKANADGTYRLRVILFVRGVRDLRVMGRAGDGHRNSFHRFVVEVQRS
jgi:hypothetical protein